MVKRGTLVGIQGGTLVGIPYRTMLGIHYRTMLGIHLLLSAGYTPPALSWVYTTVSTMLGIHHRQYHAGYISVGVIPGCIPPWVSSLGVHLRMCNTLVYLRMCNTLGIPPWLGNSPGYTSVVG